ncbi:MAG: LTA synthase family protein [Cocleimonas sp.]|nr:LTA synthase family protein [Cocleimonas sp.]
MKQKLTLVSRILLAVIIIFALMRGVLLLSNSEYFATLSLTDIFFAFAHGIRFDLSIMMALLGLPLLLLFLPFRLFSHYRYHQITAWFCFTIVLLAVLALAMDIVFFQHLQRHVGAELVQMQRDMGYLLSMLATYWFAIIGFLLFTLAFAKIWQLTVLSALLPYTTAPQKKNLPTYWQTLITLPILLFLVILIIRGGLLTGKPLMVINAFTNDSNERANLTLNGVYTGIRVSMSSNNAQHYQHHHFSDQHIQQAMGTHKAYPFEQHYLPKTNPPNIIVLQIESLNYQFIDALGNKGYGVTPYLDSLIPNATVYHRFYSAGQRSIIGLQAIWTGIPALLGFPTVDKGLSTYKITQIAKLARQNGYKTFFAQTSQRTSFRIDALANNVGFEHFWGLEDIGALQLEYPSGIRPHFGYDYETLQLLQKKAVAHFAKNPQQPMLMSFFSGTTHSPYIRLPARFEKYPYQQDGLNGMLNSIAYMDWSVQQFIEGLRDEPWFNHTIFIITADHPAARYVSKQASYDALFHIPLIIYSANPTLVQSNTLQEIRSQLDLMPTIADLIGITQPISALGTSLFQPKKHLMINNMGYLTGSLNQQGYIKTDLSKIVGSNLSQPQSLLLYQQLLMTDQRVAESLQANQWAH